MFSLLSFYACFSVIYRNYIKVKPIQIHNRKFHKFPFVYFIKNKMPPKIPDESKKMMLKVYYYFVAESKRGAPFYSWKYSNKRAAHCLNISLDSLRKILTARD
jgi:hypothetical protein